MYDADPSRRIAICDVAGQPRWHRMWDGNPILAGPQDVERGEDVQRLISAPHARPYIQYPFDSAHGWTFNTSFKCREHIAKIYLTAAEVKVGTDTRATVGPYVLIEPYTKHPNLQWPMDHWQDLVDSRPDLTFVQHVHKDSVALEGVTHISATFREACGLIAAARLYVRSESGLVHACAALGRSQVTIWGGCMDYDVMGGYPGQIGILNYTTGSPCGQWEPCHHCRDAMIGISVEMVDHGIGHGLLKRATVN